MKETRSEGETRCTEERDRVVEGVTVRGKGRDPEVLRDRLWTLTGPPSGE